MKNLVVIEGNEKLGKTKVAKRIAKDLNYNYVKFPNIENETGKEIRRILEGKEIYSPASFQALNAIDKQLTYFSGNSIIDRYTESQRIYGYLDGVSKELLDELCLGLPKPDIVFVFTGTPFCKDTEIFGSRTQQVDAFYEDYLYEMRNNPKVVRIEANKNYDETIDEIKEYIFHLGR